MHEMREAVVTANASVSTGTATSFIVGEADYFLDIFELTAANTSTVGATFSLVNDGTTVRTISVPAGGTVHLKFDVPLKQITKNTPWIVDMEDITATTLNIAAYLSKK